MAKFIEEKISIKISKLIKDDDTVERLVQGDFLEQLEIILAELVNDEKSLIEIKKES